MKICIEDDCQKEAKAPRGYCWGCYQRIRKYGTNIRVRPERGPICTVGNCGDPHHALGYCERHYANYRRCGLAGGKGKTPAGAHAEFVLAATRHTGDDCLIWPYGQTLGGYAHIRWNGRTTTAHRVVLELVAGPPPSPGLVAAHEPIICHNRLCLNPGHLRWATYLDNSWDRELDGTVNHGQRNGHAKLTDAVVASIPLDARPDDVLAELYGVRPKTIGAIRRGKGWSWLTGIGR